MSVTQGGRNVTSIGAEASLAAVVDDAAEVETAAMNCTATGTAGAAATLTTTLTTTLNTAVRVIASEGV